MELRRAAGGIVLGDAGAIAMVRRQTTTLWFFPKGGIDPGETDEDAARREIEEEAGLTDLEYIADLGTYERPRINKDGSYDLHAMTLIHMYLFAAPAHAKVQAGMEISEASWTSYREVGQKLQDERDRVWYASVFDRVREAVQRD